jgi:hypothetical protein
MPNPEVGEGEPAFGGKGIRGGTGELAGWPDGDEVAVGGTAVHGPRDIVDRLVKDALMHP